MQPPPPPGLIAGPTTVLIISFACQILCFRPFFVGQRFGVVDSLNTSFDLLFSEGINPIIRGPTLATLCFQDFLVAFLVVDVVHFGHSLLWKPGLRAFGFWYF